MYISTYLAEQLYLIDLYSLQIHTFSVFKYLHAKHINFLISYISLKQKKKIEPSNRIRIEEKKIYEKEINIFSGASNHTSIQTRRYVFTYII